MSTLTEHEKNYFRKMFDLYDTDKSGAIGFSELRNLARHLGVELSDEALLSSVRSIGVQGTMESVDLDFSQFVSWLHNAQASGDAFALLKAKITAQGNRALNNEQIARLKQVFDEFDVDGSGSIDAEELQKVFNSMGHDASLEEMQEMIAGVDDDGSGQIEFNEFLILMCSNFGAKSFEEDMRDVFEQCDPNRTGKITQGVMRKIMKEVTGCSLTDAEIDEIISSIEAVADDGAIEYMKWESLWEACREDVA